MRRQCVFFRAVVRCYCLSFFLGKIGGVFSELSHCAVHAVDFKRITTALFYPTCKLMRSELCDQSAFESSASSLANFIGGLLSLVDIEDALRNALERLARLGLVAHRRSYESSTAVILMSERQCDLNSSLMPIANNGRIPCDVENILCQVRAQLYFYCTVASAKKIR